jgi:hypothetical protein
VLRASLPEVLRFERSSTRELLVTTVVPGVSAYVQMQAGFRPSRHVERHFLSAATWLSDFHRQTMTAGGYESSRIATPGTAVHGDYWARNLLIDDDGRPGVVDWESFEEAGCPLIDVFHFPLTYGLAYPWNRYRRLTAPVAFEKTFLEPNRVSRAVSRFLRHWATAMEYPWHRMATAFRVYLETEGRMEMAGPARPGLGSIPWPLLRGKLEQASESVFSG